jgi:hypothetical protein
MSNILSIVEGVKNTLLIVGPSIAVILIILGGLTYGLSQTQPAKLRGKWQSAAIGMMIGGIIVATITAAAQYIADTSAQLLLP